MVRRYVAAVFLAGLLSASMVGAGSPAASDKAGDASKSSKASLLAAKKNAPAAIATGVTSGIHCVGGSVVSGKRSLSSNTHYLGFIGAGNHLTINFDSDFDPIAVVIGAQIGSPAPDGVARLTYVADDDSGGNLEPKVNFTTSFDGTYILVVGSNDPAVTGCYTYEVILAR